MTVQTTRPGLAIPRYQKIMFWVLLLASIAMGTYLIRLHEKAQDRMLATVERVPLSAPDTASPTPVTLLLANDYDGSLAPMVEGLNLPDEPNTRARFLLNELLAEYAKPDALHPIAQNSGVDDVFLLPMTMKRDGITGQMAVVNLSGSLAQAHPSGIEPETMTLLSMIGTLHANLPEVTEVRFLVDGEPRDTLAGHADLSRTYLAASAPGPAAIGTGEGDQQP
jgi:hypothetical protein